MSRGTGRRDATGILGLASSCFHNVALACACWLVTITMLPRAFWAWGGAQQIRRSILGAVIIAVSALIVWIGWKPVQAQFRKEHGAPSFP